MLQSLAFFLTNFLSLYRQNDVIQGPPQQRKSRWKRRTSDSAKFDSFTKLINSMLDPKTYDMQLRPDFGGETSNPERI